MTTDQSVGSPYGVTGFPTVKFFAASKNAKDYQSDRTAKAMIKFAMSEAKDLIKGRLDGKIPVDKRKPDENK